MQQKTLKKIVLEKKLRKIILLAIIVIIAMMVSCFGIAAFRQFTGGFTVNLHFRYGYRHLSIYDNSLLINPRTDIVAEPLENDMAPVTRSWFGHPDHPLIPSFEYIDSLGGGSHHGVRNQRSTYFAFTFYMRNHGIRPETYQTRIQLLDVAKNVDAGIRIVLIRDSHYYGHVNNVRMPVIYAKEALTGGPDVYSDRIFLQPDGNRGTIIFFENQIGPQEVHRFTVIMYLEGEDPEVCDEMIGGMIRLSMDFYAL